MMPKIEILFRSILGLLIMVGFLGIVSVDCNKEQQLQTGKKGMGKSVLFVWGGWKGHEPEQCRDIFVPWLREQGFEVEVSDSLNSYLNEEKMKNYYGKIFIEKRELQLHKNSPKI